MLRIAMLEITTVDLLGDIEVLQMPNFVIRDNNWLDDEPSFGENGFDVNDWIVPELYTSVTVRPYWIYEAF